MSRSRKNPDPIPTYKPTWKGAIEGWVVNFITREGWRTVASQERADLLQEAFIVFLRCAGKYPDMDTPQHFMSLFQRAWRNRYNDLSTVDSRNRKLFAPITENRDEDGVLMELREPVGDYDNDGALSTMLRQAPAEVLLVLQLFLNAPQELLELALSSWHAESSRRNQGSERINRLLGFPPEYDSVGAVRSYFTQEGAVLA